MFIPHQFRTANPLRGFPVIWMSGSTQPQIHLSCWSGLPSIPVLPAVFPGTPERLINLYILSTKNFLLQFLGRNRELIVPSFPTVAWISPLGEVALGVELARETKEKKKREKTGAVSSEVVGHDLIDSTAMKSIAPPPARPRTACALALPARETRHCLMWLIFIMPDGRWTLPRFLPPPPSPPYSCLFIGVESGVTSNASHWV